MKAFSLSKLFGSFLNLYAGSTALRSVAADLPDFFCWLEKDQRRVIPVAFVARKLGVSVRLVWRWIELGLLKRKKTFLKGESRGIERKKLKTFLERLEYIASSALPWESNAGRPASAMNALREANHLLREGQGRGLKPGEYAELIGVSRTSVHRAMKTGFIEHHRPTPHGPRIGRKPIQRKESKVRKEFDTVFRPKHAKGLQKPCETPAKALRGQNTCMVIL